MLVTLRVRPACMGEILALSCDSGTHVFTEHPICLRNNACSCCILVIDIPAYVSPQYVADLCNVVAFITAFFPLFMHYLLHSQPLFRA